MWGEGKVLARLYAVASVHDTLILISCIYDKNQNLTNCFIIIVRIAKIKNETFDCSLNS